MAVAAKTKAPRTLTRDEPAVAAARMPERAPERDPNKIYTRDGREVDLQHIANQHTDDYTNLASLGIIEPPGWKYEWRTIKVKGAEYTQGIVRDAKAGWTPVPASRHPGKIMPMGYEGPIVHDGQMLMERDIRLVAVSRQMNDRAANDQLNISRNMTGLMQRHSPNVDMLLDQSDPAARRGTGVKIERIPMGDPSKNYTYTLDE